MREFMFILKTKICVVMDVAHCIGRQGDTRFRSFESADGVRRRYGWWRASERDENETNVRICFGWPLTTTCEWEIARERIIAFDGMQPMCNESIHHHGLDMCSVLGASPSRSSAYRLQHHCSRFFLVSRTNGLFN